MKSRAFFIIFKERLIARYCLRRKSAPLILQSLQKDCHSIDLLELSNFGNPSGSGKKKGYKRLRSKNTFDKGKQEKQSRQLNEALFRQFLQQS